MSDSEIVKEFLVESYENLDRLDRELMALEKDPGDRRDLASVFRTIHTIKGTWGFLAFNKLETVAHVGENLLTRLRDGLLTLNAEITTALLAMVDAVRQMLGSIETDGQRRGAQRQELIATLTRLLQPQTESSAPPEPSAMQRRKPGPTTCLNPHEHRRHPHQPGRGQGESSLRCGGAAEGGGPAPHRRDSGGEGGRASRKMCWKR